MKAPRSLDCENHRPPSGSKQHYYVYARAASLPPPVDRSVLQNMAGAVKCRKVFEAPSTRCHSLVRAMGEAIVFPQHAANEQID